MLSRGSLEICCKAGEPLIVIGENLIGDSNSCEKNKVQFHYENGTSKGRGYFKEYFGFGHKSFNFGK